jgi:hypothetical protein
MHQQINLYQPIFSEARKPLSFGVVVAGFAVVIAALGGYSAYVSAKNGALLTTIEALRDEQASQQALLDVSGEDSAVQEAAAIQARITALNHSIGARRAAIEVLRSGAAGQTSGFAARMEALARRHVDGLWIDKLILSGTTGTMSIGGSTLNPDTVPVYLRSLAQESVLSGTRFDEFVIERPSAEPVSDTTSSNDGELDKPVKKSASLPKHIRFRAGSTALTRPAGDASAMEPAT